MFSVIFCKFVCVWDEVIVDISWGIMLVLISVFVELFIVDKLKIVLRVVFFVLVEGLIDSIWIRVLLLVLVIYFLFVFVSIILDKCFVRFICVFLEFWFRWVSIGFMWFVWVICKILKLMFFRLRRICLVMLLFLIFLLLWVEVIWIKVMMVFFFVLICVFKDGINDNLCRRLIVVFVFLLM